MLLPTNEEYKRVEAKREIPKLKLRDNGSPIGRSVMLIAHSLRRISIW